jgi:hypothetical protein
MTWLEEAEMSLDASSEKAREQDQCRLRQRAGLGAYLASMLARPERMP